MREYRFKKHLTAGLERSGAGAHHSSFANHRKRLALAVFLPLFLLTAVLSGCGTDGRAWAGTGPDRDWSLAERNAEGAARERRLQVVATIFPQYDFARQIAQDMADVHLLLRPGEEVHSYEPTPQDIRMIQNCDLFIYTGGENDVWVENILAGMDVFADPQDGEAHPEGNTGEVEAGAGSEETGTKKPERRTEVSGPRAVRLLNLVETYEEEHLEGMMPEREGHGEEDADREKGEEREEEEEEPDEHVWTSPENCAILIDSLTDQFCLLDPAHEKEYRANGKAYRDQFIALDEAYRDMVFSSSKRAVIFGDRFPFRYLAESYGLTCYAAFPGCSSESEPSAATIAFLIEKAVSEEVPVIFRIEFSNGNIARAICEAAQERRKEPVQVLMLHSCHNLTRDEFAAGETCLSLMTQNLEALRAALE